jgi:hypothetical protein
VLVVRFASPIRTRSVLRCCGARACDLSGCAVASLFHSSRLRDHILVLPLCVASMRCCCRWLLPIRTRGVLRCAAPVRVLCPCVALCVSYSIAFSFVIISSAASLLRCSVGCGHSAASPLMPPSIARAAGQPSLVCSPAALSLEHAALVTVDMRDASRVLYIDYLMLMCMTPTHSASFRVYVSY